MWFISYKPSCNNEVTAGIMAEVIARNDARHVVLPQSALNRRSDRAHIAEVEVKASQKWKRKRHRSGSKPVAKVEAKALQKWKGADRMGYHVR